AGEEARLLALGRAGGGEAGRFSLGACLLLRLRAEREPQPVEEARIEAREHVALVLPLVGGAREQQPALALDDPCVVAGREPRRPDVPGEGEQLRETEAPVATSARIRRLAAGVPRDERCDDGATELLTQVEGDVRD